MGKPTDTITPQAVPPQVTAAEEPTAEDNPPAAPPEAPAAGRAPLQNVAERHLTLDNGADQLEDIESFIRSLKFEHEIAAQLPAGTTLADFVKMEPAQTAEVLRKAMPAMQQTIERAQDKARQVQEVQAGGGAKFGGVLKGGPYEAFLSGVTGIVQEPHAELEKGMLLEHTEMPDSHTKFSTGNYGLTTAPSLEYELVESGGSGLARKKVDGSEEERVVVTGTRGAFKDGQEGEDLRVLRPLTYYGNFTEDGRLAIAPEDEVVVGATFFTPAAVEEEEKEEWEEEELKKGIKGKVLKFNASGAAKIKFDKGFGVRWVPKEKLVYLHPLPNDADTHIQRTVKQARLRRVEVKAVILYTGPLFTLYNSILREFGSCGEVAAGVEFGSEEFWKQLNEVSIDEWVRKSGHRFTNAIHALASAIKKLQRLSQDEQGTLLWRGLGGLDMCEFLAGCGFTDRAFMSSTKDRRTAMEYSGVKKGLVGTVMCIETSTTNNGAEITAFSQYTGEAETVWGACSFLQNLKGREEVVLPEEGGIVKIFHVLCSANSKALTVEELEGRNKTVAVNMLQTVHNRFSRSGLPPSSFYISIRLYLYRERETDRERERERQTETETVSDRDRQRKRERERKGKRES